jgi:hypothetical protein
MKKIMLLFVLIIIMISCKKTDSGADVPATSVCAKCEELKSHYKPADYCGTPAAVDAYIKALKDNGVQYDQNWSCTKY